MLKRSTAFVLSFVLILLVFLCACQEEPDFGDRREPNGHIGDMSRNEGPRHEKETEKTKNTFEFYELVNRSETFWFKMEIVTDDERYYFTQATNGKNIATVVDHQNSEDDRYEITEFKKSEAYVYTLNLAEKKYDTLVTTNHQSLQNFLFGGEDSRKFAEPTQKGDIQKKDKVFYSERFETTSEEGGKADGFNLYYFDNGRLALVEVNEKGNLTMTMRVLDYGTEIPGDIYLTPPDSFAKGKFEIDTTVDYGSLDWFE